MNSMLRATCLLCAAAVAGCGAQEVLLGTKGSYLFTAEDVLARPGEQVDLTARVRAGDLLAGRAGLVVRFRRQGRIFKAAETDGEGVAVVSFAAPSEGDYALTAELAPLGIPDAPPPPQTLLVACREADTPIAVVDLDKTLVASGFDSVLVGEAEPMPGSAEVLNRLARSRTIVYLTHRPDYFGPKSKAWLARNGYPRGPLLLSSLRGFLAGSEAFKTEMLGRLRGRFRNLEVGIGDKVSDAAAYHASGMKAFLIVRLDEGAALPELEAQLASLRALPAGVHVVTRWSQIGRALFGGAAPGEEVLERLEALIRARRPAGGTEVSQ